MPVVDTAVAVVAAVFLIGVNLVMVYAAFATLRSDYHSPAAPGRRPPTDEEIEPAR